MKQVISYTAIIVFVTFLYAMNAGCSTKLDNYTSPSCTIKGSVIDEGTDSTVQTEIGSGGTRVKLLETSYSSNPTPQYFQCMQDGTFNNDKIFPATYKVSVEGPFVPIVQTDASGNVVADSSQTINLTSTATLTFKVQPFLRIEWVGQPVFNSDTSVTVKVRITRGTSNSNYQTNVTDVNLYVSNTQYNGNNNYDPRYSLLQSFSTQQQSDSLLSNVITLTTKGGALPAQDVYFRVGARISAGLNQYNYTKPIGLTYP